MTPPRVTRSVHLDAPAADVWAAVGRVDGLGTWLGTDIRADHDTVAAGRTATVTDRDGTVRRLVVTEVDEGRSVGFVWWDQDRPDRASTVTVTLAGGTDGDDGDGTTVTVTETLDPAAAATGLDARASVRGAADAVAAGWDVRLANLCAALAPGLVSA